MTTTKIEMDDVDIAMRELQKLPTKKKEKEKKKYIPPFELLTVNEVAEALRLSANTIYRMVNKNSSSYEETFPQPVRIGGNSTMWRSDEITAYMLGLKRGALGKSPSPAKK